SETQLPTADPAAGVPHDQRLELVGPEVRLDVDPTGLQRPLAPVERVLAYRVDDDVEHRTTLRQVLARVVDHLVCAEGTDELDVPRARDTGDVRAEVLRELDCRRSEGARRAVDDHPGAGADGSNAEGRERLHRAIADRRGLLE